MWEYRIEQVKALAIRRNVFAGSQGGGDAERQLVAQLGAEGWELVNAVPVTEVGTLNAVRLYFKRPRLQ